MKYIGFYSEPTLCQNRYCVLSAKNKMDYIIDVLIYLNYPVDIISTSSVLGSKPSRGKRMTLTKGGTLTFFPSLGSGSRILKHLDNLFINFCLFFYLIFKTRKDERIIVYHSLNYMTVINIAKHLKRFQLILEVEEIYSDVIQDEKKKAKEIKFINTADYYIYSTELLGNTLNVQKKPSVVCYGSYIIPNHMPTPIFNDNKIHVVYAGTFDPVKGGAMNAITSAKYLPPQYHLHILGFGTDSEIDAVRSLITQVQQVSTSTISYDGLLNGEEYINFLQNCQIGLSTQIPFGAFNASSFPSKILSYMSNGLHVVSVHLGVLSISQLDKFLNYCDDGTPYSIAKAIQTVDLNNGCSSYSIVKMLDKEFKSNFKKNILQ